MDKQSDFKVKLLTLKRLYLHFYLYFVGAKYAISNSHLWFWLVKKTAKKRYIEEEVLSLMAEELRCHYILYRVKVRYDSCPYLALKIAHGFNVDEHLEWQFIDADGESFLAETFQAQTTKAVDDVQARPQKVELPEKVNTLNLRSALYYTLEGFNGSPLGTLSLYRKELNPFSNHALEKGKIFVNWLASRLDRRGAPYFPNTTLWPIQKELSGTERLKKLNNRCQNFIATGDFNTTLDKVAQVASKHFKCEMAGIGLYDNRREEIIGNPKHGYVGVDKKYVKDFKFSISEPGGLPLRDNKIYKCLDAQEDPNIFGEYYTRSIGIRGIMAGPLRVDEKKIGILYIGSKDPRQFSPFDEKQFAFLAQLAAYDLRNIKLHEGQLEAKENEKKRTSKEDRNQIRFRLHDEIGNFQFRVQSPLEKFYEELLEDNQNILAGKLKEILQNTRKTSDTFRLIMDDMRHPILREEGLAVALSAYLNSIQGKSNEKERIQLHIQGDEQPSPEIESALFDIARECILNAQKYAGEDAKIVVTLYINEKETVLIVRDDGAGFIQEKNEHQQGFEMIRHYCKQFDGYWTCDSEPDKGTKHVVKIPRNFVELGKED